MENLSYTLSLNNEFREHRLAVGRGDDVLQIYPMLYFGYCWLSSRYPPAAQSNILLPATSLDIGTAKRSLQQSLSPTADLPSDTFDDTSADLTHSNSVHSEFIPALPSPSVIDPQIPSISSNKQRKVDRQRERNKARKRDLNTGERVGPNRIFACELCAGTFDRGGILQHL
jgi:hypothetical protein